MLAYPLFFDPGAFTEPRDPKLEFAIHPPYCNGVVYPQLHDKALSGKYLKKKKKSGYVYALNVQYQKQKFVCSPLYYLVSDDEIEKSRAEQFWIKDSFNEQNICWLLVMSTWYEAPIMFQYSRSSPEQRASPRRIIFNYHRPLSYEAHETS